MGRELDNGRQVGRSLLIVCLITERKKNVIVHLNEISIVGH